MASRAPKMNPCVPKPSNTKSHSYRRVGAGLAWCLRRRIFPWRSLQGQREHDTSRPRRIPARCTALLAFGYFWCTHLIIPCYGEFSHSHFKCIHPVQFMLRAKALYTSCSATPAVIDLETASKPLLLSMGGECFDFGVCGIGGAMLDWQWGTGERPLDV